MTDVVFYFKEGWQHIISTDALDHQLFVLALIASYTVKDWRKILILVTAFTIGHSITLLLSVYNIVIVNTTWVEFLIPCTIIITAATNFFYAKLNTQKKGTLYIFALLFGLIHGLGFANTIRFMLAKGQSIGTALLGFNIGLEVGQIVVVACTLLINYLLIQHFKLKPPFWIYGVSLVNITWAVKFALERIP